MSIVLMYKISFQSCRCKLKSTNYVYIKTPIPNVFWLKAFLNGKIQTVHSINVTKIYIKHHIQNGPKMKGGREKNNVC